MCFYGAPVCGLSSKRHHFIPSQCPTKYQRPDSQVSTHTAIKWLDSKCQLKLIFHSKDSSPTDIEKYIKFCWPFIKSFK